MEYNYFMVDFQGRRIILNMAEVLDIIDAPPFSIVIFDDGSNWPVPQIPIEAFQRFQKIKIERGQSNGNT